MLARRYLVARVGRQFCLVPACMFGGQFFQSWQADDQLALKSWTCCLNPRFPYSWAHQHRAGQRGLLVAASLFRSRIAAVSGSIIRFIPELETTSARGQNNGGIRVTGKLRAAQTRVADCFYRFVIGRRACPKAADSFRVAPVLVQLLSD
jgi:hypothetical protein